MDFSRASDVFDLYVDWGHRLAREIPFLKQVLTEAGGRRVADVACGTGRHAAALAAEGFTVAGFDPDERLLDRARREYGSGDLPLSWISASFADLPAKAGLHQAGRPRDKAGLPKQPPSLFDGVVCLGNSISLVAPEEMAAAVANMARVMAPGAVAVIHTINYPVLARRKEEPWGPVRRLEDGTLLLKGFVSRGEEPWDAVFISLRPSQGGKWEREVSRFRLHPHSRREVVRAAEDCGLRSEAVYGGFRREDPGDEHSADLVYVFSRSVSRP